MGNVIVPFLFADFPFEIRKECVALLVRYSREGIVWIFAFEVGD